ncbi:MAG: hypothetical protein AAFV07_07265 [Bacteroidota bacterium]
MRLNLTIPGREVNDGMLEALKEFLVQHEYAGEYNISIETQQQKPAPAPEKPVGYSRPTRQRSTGHHPSVARDTNKSRITVSARRPTGSSATAAAKDTRFNLEDPEVASKNGKFKFRKR